MQGVVRYKVRLLPHCPEWKEEYEQVAAQIRALWGDAVLDVQHVGSTAIPSICAKPILDVAVALRSVEDMDVQAMERAGYQYCGAQKGIEGYHLFVMRGADGVLSLRHIHCYGPGHEDFRHLVGFRDYLNRHPECAKRYEALKSKLAAEFPDDRIAYGKGKEEFINWVYAQLDTGD